jgi:hypothetical protein
VGLRRKDPWINRTFPGLPLGPGSPGSVSRTCGEAETLAWEEPSGPGGNIPELAPRIFS